MKKITFTLIELICLLISVSSVNAQWVQLDPTGGFINNFFVSGNTVYAAAYGGVLVSKDAGLSWSHSNFGIMDGDVRSVAVNSKKVFAGTYDNGVYVKDINGLIWVQTPLNNETISCLAVIGDNVYAGTYSEGVYLSTDNGTTWNQVNTGLGSLQVNCLAVSGTNIFAGVEEDRGVYLSTDSGNNWTFAGNGLPNNSPISLAVNGTDIYTGIWANGVYTSPNNGTGWLQLGQSPSNYIGAIAFNGSKVFAAGQKIGVTTNGGVNWTDISTSETEGLPWANIQALCFAGGNLIAGDNAVNVSTGIYVSNNDGASWVRANSGVPDFCSNGIAASNGCILNATSAGIFRTSNDGAEWDNPTLHGSDYYRWADFSTVAFRSGLYAFAGDVNGYAYVSSDAGVNWDGWIQIEKGASITSFAFISTFVFAATKPFEAGVEGGVYKSLDNGGTWSRVSNGLPTAADTNTNVTSLAVIGNNLFAGTGHGVFLSTDYGTSWAKVNNGFTGNLVNALTVKGNELFAGTFGMGVFRSSDNGANWTHTSLITDVTALTVVDTNLFAGTWSSGIYRLKNWDSTWIPVGLPNEYVTSFAFNNGYLYAATNNSSVWRRPISEITGVKEIKVKIPSEFSLAQNYPNPFNPSSIIEFKLASRQFITLKVYDILGKEIKTLVNEERPAGSYSVLFNAAGISSGVYFYKIQAGKFSETKKMILLR